MNNTRVSGASVLPRSRWMGILARSDEAEFFRLWDGLNLSPEYTVLKPAEQGLVMVRGRAGGSGKPFNLGEMTVTRCSVKLADGTIGQSYIMGRKSACAEKAALVDALMQSDRYSALVEENLISVLEKAELDRRAGVSRKAAATKVDFFTMVRGEDQAS